MKSNLAKQMLWVGNYPTHMQSARPLQNEGQHRTKATQRSFKAHLQDFGNLNFVFSKNDISRAVVSNIVAGFRVVGGVYTTPNASSLQKEQNL